MFNLEINVKYIKVKTKILTHLFTFNGLKRVPLRYSKESKQYSKIYIKVKAINILTYLFTFNQFTKVPFLYITESIKYGKSDFTNFIHLISKHSILI